MGVTRGGQGALQVPHHVFDWAMLLARDGPQRLPVMPLRFEADGVKQYGGGHMVRVGDERHVHPGADGFILNVQAAGVPASPGTEHECRGDGHAKGDQENQ
jgi:hypothetical protein